MSEVIENRVVQMAFDNTKFEKGVRATLNLLDRLNSAIAGLNGIKYNVLGLADAVKSVTFDPINQQMQIGVGKAMALTAALTGVYNISNQIYNTITSTFRSMTFDQIYNGYSRYEQMVNSTQVILNATKKAGETEEQAMERVEAMQERLLWFADETSYDAMTMLDTAGKFLNRGFDINLVSTAMEGIANWAATAGVNAQGATVAMQQLAQAMGSPYIRQQDWISIAGLNMDTKQFKELVIQSALAHKTLKKVGDEIQTLDGKMKVTANDMEKSFSKGWFTNEVLMDVLEQYGKANDLIRKVQEENPGFTVTDAIEELRKQGVSEEYELSLQAFEMGQVARTFSDAIGSIQTAAATKFAGLFKIFIGDYLDAKELWTGVSEELYDLFIEPLNVLLDGFNRWSTKYKGVVRFWDSTKKIWNSIKEVLTDIHKNIFSAFGSEASGELELYDVLVRRVSDTLVKMTLIYENISNKVENFAKKVKENNFLWMSVHQFFWSIKQAFELVKIAGESFYKQLLIPLLHRLEEAAPRILLFLSSDLKIMITDLKDAAEKTDFFNILFGKTYEILDKVITKIEEFAELLQAAFDKIREHSIDDGEKGFFSSLVKDADETRDSLDKLVDFIFWALDTISLVLTTLMPIIDGFIELLGKVGKAIAGVFEELTPAFEFLGQLIKDLISTIGSAFETNNGVNGSTNIIFENLAEGIGRLLGAISSSNLHTLKEFFELIRNEFTFYHEKLFKGDDLVSIFKELVPYIISLMVALTFMIKPITVMSRLIEAMHFYEWDGILGQLLWGESLTNVTDQLYYKALAQTFAAVCDCILSISAALFVVSLIKPERLESSVKVIMLIVGLVMLIVAEVELLMEVLDRLTSYGKIIKKRGGNKWFAKLADGFNETFGSVGDAFALSAKFTGLAQIIGAIGNSIIKISIALMLLSTIDEAKLKNGVGALAIMSGILLVMISSIGAIIAALDSLSRLTTNKKGFLSLNRSIKSDSQLAFTFASIGILIAFISTAILNIAKALKKVTDAMKSLESEEDIWMAVGVISTLMSLMMIFFAEIAILGKTTTKTTSIGKEGKEIINTATNFLTIARMIGVLALAISVMIAAVMLLGHMEEKGQNVLLLLRDLGMILGALVLLIGVIIGAGYAAKHIEPGSLEKMALAIVALTPPLLALAALVGVMSLIDDAKIVTIAAALDLIFGGIATMIGVSAISQPAQMMAFAGAMALMMLSLLSFIPILNILIKFGDQTGAALAAMIELAAILVVFGSIVAIIGAIVGNTEYGPAIMAAAGFIDMLAGAFVLMGLAFALVGSTITNALHEINVLIMLIEELERIDGDKVAENL